MTQTITYKVKGTFFQTLEEATKLKNVLDGINKLGKNPEDTKIIKITTIEEDI